MEINKEFKPIRSTGFWKKENLKVFVYSFTGEYELDELSSIVWELCKRCN